MTNQSFPITPPPELIAKWASSMCGYVEAAQWGADTELDACCKYLTRRAEWEPEDVMELRDFRRPKPPSLKEQAIFAAAVLQSLDEICSIPELKQHWQTIRSALEALND